MNIGTWIGRIIAVGLLALVLVQPALAAEKRGAFAVGNSAYRHADPLPNTVNDARATAARLRRLGFSVVEVIDADVQGFRAALFSLERTLPGAKLGLVFYAGHGMAIDGVNYAFPIDANLQTEGDIDSQLVAVAEIIGLFMEQQTQTLVLLDACRNNPFYDQVSQFDTRTVTRGLAKVQSVRTRGSGGLSRMDSNALDMYVAFATQPGNTAADGIAGARHSPFTSALLQHLDERVEIRQLMTRVRSSVVSATGGYQIPWDQSSLMRPIYLAGEPQKRAIPRRGRGRVPPP